MKLMPSNMQTIIAEKLLKLYDMNLILVFIIILLVINLLVLLLFFLTVYKVIGLIMKPFVWLYKMFTN